MDMWLKRTLNVILAAMMLSACTSPYKSIIDVDKSPVNLIPMYGYPDIEKTESQKKADERFIRAFSDSAASREKASKEFAGRGWFYLQQGDGATSMRRFNQSWLLDPGYYLPYWGFGVLLNMQDKAAEATPHFDKALLLIEDKNNDKPRLLADAAKAYVARGRDNRATDAAKSVEFLEKANSLANEVFRLDSVFGKEALQDAQFAGAYYYGDRLAESELDAANVAYVQGNYDTALKKYSLLAKQDVPEAQISLGNMYRKGQGVPQDYEEAVKWYRMAAELGSATGQYSMGFAYQQGYGVQQDYGDAMRWYRKAAEQGYSDAQNNIGYLYGSGLGVPQDNIKAYMWYNIASASGHKEGIRNRNYVAKKMSAAQVKEAEKISREWMESHY